MTVDSLAVRPDGSTPLRVNFARVDDARVTHYTVYRSPDGLNYDAAIAEVPRVVGAGEPAVYSHTDPTPQDGKKYWYRIRPAFQESRPDGSTVTHHLATTNEAWRVAAVPGVTDLTAHQVTPTTVRLDWTRRATTATVHRVYRIDPDGSATLVQTVGGQATTATISGLTAGASHRFRVVAANDAIGSVGVDVRIGSGLSARVSNVLDGILLEWDAPGGVDPATIMGFDVERQRPDGSWQWVTLVETYGAWDGSAPLAHTDAQVARGRSYAYRVTPRVSAGPWDPYGEPLPSARLGPVSVLYPAKPTYAWTSDSITLEWPDDGTAPPPTLEFTLTDPVTGASTTRTVQGTPGANGRTRYVVDDLASGTAYDVRWRDPSAGDGGPASESDESTPITTRVFRDSVALLGPYADPDVIGQWSPETDVAAGTLAGVVKRDGESATLDLSNIPEHRYALTTGRVTLYPRGLEEGEDPEDVMVLADLIGSASVTISAPGGTVDTIVPEPSPAVWHNGFTERLYFNFTSGWQDHSGDSAAITLTANGMGPGWSAYFEVLAVQVGTPTATIEGGGTAQESAEPEISFTVRRGNSVANDKPLTVNLEKSGSATEGQDFEGLPTTVTLGANELEKALTVQVKNDRDAEGPKGHLGYKEDVIVAVKSADAYKSAGESAKLDIIDNSAWFADAAWKIIESLSSLQRRILGSPISTPRPDLSANWGGTVRQVDVWFEQDSWERLPSLEVFSNDWGEAAVVNATVYEETQITVGAGAEASIQIPQGLGSFTLSSSIGFSFVNGNSGTASKTMQEENAKFVVRPYILKRSVVRGSVVYITRPGEGETILLHYDEETVAAGYLINQFDYEVQKKSRYWLDRDSTDGQDVIEI